MSTVCKNKIEDLNLMADNMLNPQSRADLVSHMEKCSGCKIYYEDITALKAGMGKLEVKAPENLAASIGAAVEKSRKKQAGVRRLYYVSSFAAACLVVAFAVFVSGGFGLWNKAGRLSDTSEEMLDGGGVYQNLEDSRAPAPDKQDDNSILGMGGEEEEFVTMTEACDPEKSFDTRDAEKAVIADYGYYTSAFVENDPVYVNERGTRLDEGISPGHDVFYVSCDYRLDEIMEILSSEYPPDIIEFELDESEDIDFIQVKSNARTLKNLETRFGLIASVLIRDATDTLTAKISSTETE